MRLPGNGNINAEQYWDSSPFFMDSQKVNIPVITGKKKQFHASWLIEFMGLLCHVSPSK